MGSPKSCESQWTLWLKLLSSLTSHAAAKTCKQAERCSRKWRGCSTKAVASFHFRPRMEWQRQNAHEINFREETSKQTEGVRLRLGSQRDNTGPDRPAPLHEPFHRADFCRWENGKTRGICRKQRISVVPCEFTILRLQFRTFTRKQVIVLGFS